MVEKDKQQILLQLDSLCAENSALSLQLHAVCTELNEMAFGFADPDIFSITELAARLETLEKNAHRCWKKAHRVLRQFEDSQNED